MNYNLRMVTEHPSHVSNGVKKVKTLHWKMQMLMMIVSRLYSLKPIRIQIFVIILIVIVQELKIEKLNIRCWENNFLQSTILGVRWETKRVNFTSLDLKNRNRQFALLFAVIIVFENHFFSQKYHCRSIDLVIIFQKKFMDKNCSQFSTNDYF